MNTPTVSLFASILPDWTLTSIMDRVAFTSPCKRVGAALRLEHLVSGKGRRAIRKTEWVLRVQGVPGFDGIGNADVRYFVRALEQSVLNADAREHLAEEDRLAKIRQAVKDGAIIHGMLSDCGFFGEVFEVPHLCVEEDPQDYSKD